MSATSCHGSKAAATRFKKVFNPSLCRRDAVSSLEILAKLQDRDPAVTSWVNFPILNKSGDENDLRLEDYAGAPRWTRHATQLPYAVGIVDELAREEVTLAYACIGDTHWT